MGPVSTTGCSEASQRSEQHSPRSESMAAWAGDRKGFFPSPTRPVKTAGLDYPAIAEPVHRRELLEHAFDPYTDWTAARDSLRGVVNVGDRVRIGVSGVSVFTVVEIEGDRAVVESIEDVPGRYPWSARVADLVPAED
ncbi:hypothetical protein NONI108955_41855 [Nocardia ninae]